MKRKIVLITGANRGLGLETARHFAEEGHIVYLGSRNLHKGKTVAAGIPGSIPLHLDLNDPHTFTAAAEIISADHGRLDVLINNAGIMPEPDIMRDSTRDVPADILKNAFDTNFFGVVSLSNTLLPLLLKSEAPRIVNLSSNVGSLTLHASGAPLMKTFAYNASKTALNSYTVHLANACADTPLKVNSAHPGWLKTDMGTDYAPMEVREGLETVLWLANLPDDGPSGGFFHKQEKIAW
ncbi:SDR family NAD(P)-dependent oxidoreductase [Chitinophaga sedimenti]|uniref:SDR family NAD(P)-dependent oxidoreductase n=1 Tax=Chitinophaga sedimenti TaxID=2033606 RepID=UPI00200666FE|nr:SDR family NAD(P)-dependent oxidoreductase [Chitinophaga sedimenti]MCK7554218.1 SDR family NAD(P)-dependent oxidoreductase [Chitinophaga sedimenti]